MMKVDNCRANELDSMVYEGKWLTRSCQEKSLQFVSLDLVESESIITKFVSEGIWCLGKYMESVGRSHGRNMRLKRGQGEDQRKGHKILEGKQTRF